MKKFFAVIMTIVLCGALASCGAKDNNKVVIFTSSEDYRNEHIAARLKEQFPNYNITMQYLSTGNNAAKLKSEGANTECDIVLGLESGYLKSLNDMFADVSAFDKTVYVSELVNEGENYLPWERFSGCIAINTKILADKGLSKPTSYNDLLKPEYKGLVSMPSPKTSGTGFMFLRSLINELGEDEAFAYFDKLSDNILQFTSSGSGPVNALIQGEVAIGLGMTFQAVNQINEKQPIEILFFDEGAPFTSGGLAIIKGKQDKPAVTDVFKFIAEILVHEDKDLFCPEPIFNEQTINMKSYPTDIKYADMTGIENIAEKERILTKWKY